MTFESGPFRCSGCAQTSALKRSSSKSSVLFNSCPAVVSTESRWTNVFTSNGKEKTRKLYLFNSFHTRDAKTTGRIKGKHYNEITLNKDFRIEQSAMFFFTQSDVF